MNLLKLTTCLAAAWALASCGEAPPAPAPGPPQTEAEARALSAEIGRAHDAYRPIAQRFVRKQDAYYALARAGVQDPARLVPVLEDLLAILDQLDPLADEILKLNERTGVPEMVASWQPALKNNADRRREITHMLAVLRKRAQGR